MHASSRNHSHAMCTLHHTIYKIRVAHTPVANVSFHTRNHKCNLLFVSEFTMLSPYNYDNANTSPVFVIEKSTFHAHAHFVVHSPHPWTWLSQQLNKFCTSRISCRIYYLKSVYMFCVYVNMKLRLMPIFGLISYCSHMNWHERKWKYTNKISWKW